MRLSYQRPAPICRTFESLLVEEIISDLTSRMEDQDLARLFENAFPNTLDTTVKWHVDGTEREQLRAMVKALEMLASGRAPRVSLSLEISTLNG